MLLDFIKISISCALAFSVAACASHGLPKIERDSNKTARLVVEGKPFVVLGGELLNSSGSTASDMQKHWDGLADLNLNTVLLAVAWEQIEKSEGVFDFSEIGKIISQARERKMKLVLLWFDFPDTFRIGPCAIQNASRALRAKADRTGRAFRLSRNPYWRLTRRRLLSSWNLSPKPILLGRS